VIGIHESIPTDDLPREQEGEEELGNEKDAPNRNHHEEKNNERKSKGEGDETGEGDGGPGKSGIDSRPLSQTASSGPLSQTASSGFSSSYGRPSVNHSTLYLYVHQEASSFMYVLLPYLVITDIQKLLLESIQIILLFSN
jgi:hypothetical protein